MLVSEVFVSGTFPKETYVIQEDANVESEVANYITRSRGKCLLISGPSKSGKTSLVDKLFYLKSKKALAIYMSGSDFDSESSFFEYIASKLSLTSENAESDSLSQDILINGSISPIPRVIKFSLSGKDSSSYSQTQKKYQHTILSVVDALKDNPLPIIIDDFHFIPEELQKVIAPHIKRLIRETHVIVLSISENAFRQIKSVPDMNGKMEHIRFGRWSVNDLEKIAQKGFSLLNIVDGMGVKKELAERSSGSPLIMQIICIHYVMDILNVFDSNDLTVTTTNDFDINKLCSNVAQKNVHSDFEYLLKGGSGESKRKIVNIKGLGNGDVYKAVLYSLSKMGNSNIFYKSKIISEVSSITTGFSNPNNSVSNCLNGISNVAKVNKFSAEPSLVYDGNKLEIIDPFLSFYLQNHDWNSSNI